jgi:YHS domain-containing protein
MSLATKNKKTVIDPVCGMDVGSTISEIKTILKGETFYFCAESCRKAFVDNPEKYLKPKPAKKKGWWCRYTERLEKSTGGKAMKCH